MSVALAVELARPVVRSLLPLASAEAALALALVREERAGTSPGAGSFDEKWRIDCHILRLNVEIQEDARDKAIEAIARVIKPMIRAHLPWNHLLAAAHDINGRTGFLLLEPEVAKIVETEVWFALPPAPHPRRSRV